jgi:NitT/TauT family transport system substrate-binding protein
MKRFTSLCALVAASALALAAAACGGGASSSSSGTGTTKVTLTLNWVPYGEHAPFYYGLKKGFYSAEGIDLVLRNGTGSGNTIQAVAQQNTDFGWADTPPLLKGVGKGLKVKSVGVFLQKGPASIESLASKNITKPADLKGKTVAGTPGDALYATFPGFLKANGLSKDDVRVVDVDAAGKIPALTGGKVDAIMGFFNDQAPTIEAKTGQKVNYLLYADYGMNMLGTGLIVNNDTLKSKPDLVRRFVRATQKSWTEAAKDIDGATTAMAELAEQEPAKAVLDKQLKLAVSLLNLQAGNPGVNTEAKWNETINLMSQFAGLQNAAAPGTYWDATYAANKG